MEPQFLYKKDRKGNYRVWRTFAEGDQVVVEYGSEGGNLTRRSRTAIAKNVGKSNATTPEEQAQKEADASTAIQLTKGYFSTKELADKGPDVLLPMRAVLFDDQEHLVDERGYHGAWAQPKLNGIRGTLQWVAEEEKYGFFTKSGKRVPFTHLEDSWNNSEKVKQFLKEQGEDRKTRFMWDGEFYVHEMSLQDLSSVVNSVREGSKHEREEHVDFMIYDVVCKDAMKMTYTTRRGAFIRPLVTYTEESNNLLSLKDIQQRGDALIELREKGQCMFVKDRAISLWSDMDRFYERCLSYHFEGTMYRYDTEGYITNLAQSKALQKRKPWYDNEFVCVGSTVDVEGGIVLVFRNDVNDHTFELRPKGTLEERKQMVAEADKYLGTIHTVSYRERTKDNDLPFHCSLEIERNYE